MQSENDRIIADLMEQLIECGPDGMVSAFTALLPIRLTQHRLYVVLAVGGGGCAAAGVSTDVCRVSGMVCDRGCVLALSAGIALARRLPLSALRP